MIKHCGKSPQLLPLSGGIGDRLLGASASPIAQRLISPLANKLRDVLTVPIATSLAQANAIMVEQFRPELDDVDDAPSVYNADADLLLDALAEKFAHLEAATPLLCQLRSLGACDRRTPMESTESTESAEPMESTEPTRAGQTPIHPLPDTPPPHCRSLLTAGGNDWEMQIATMAKLGQDAVDRGGLRGNPITAAAVMAHVMSTSLHLHPSRPTANDLGFGRKCADALRQEATTAFGEEPNVAGRESNPPRT